MSAQAALRLLVERRILAKLAKGPVHARSMQPVLRQVGQLVERGLARRFIVPPGTVPLYVEITDAGRERLKALRDIKP